MELTGEILNSAIRRPVAVVRVLGHGRLALALPVVTLVSRFQAS